MATYLQDPRFFDAKFILPASTNRSYLSCPARRKLIAINTTTNSVVLESATFSADTGAVAVAPYNTTSDLGTLWTATADGKLWSLPVTSSAIGTPVQRLTFCRNNWLAVISATTTWIAVPLKSGGIALVDATGTFATKFYEGAISNAAFGLAAGPYLYLFDGKGAGVLMQFNDALGLQKVSDFDVPGAVDIIDGVIVASGSGAIALPTSFVLASQARDATMVYSTDELASPTLVTRTAYEDQGYTLNGVFNDSVFSPVTKEEFPGLGISPWFPASAGRDDLTGSVLTTSAGNGRLQAIVQGGSMVDISNSTVTASGTLIARTMAARTAEVYNVKDFGAIGDGVSHPLNSSQAAVYNTQYGAYGLVAAVGDENDWVAIQAALFRAANTGVPVYIPTGNYITTKPLQLQWTSTPITGQPAHPLVSKIYGDGYSSQISGTISSAGRAVLELLGYNNGDAVNCELSSLRLSMLNGNSQAYCLRVGDAWSGFKAYRVACEGANGCLLRVADSSSYANLDTSFDQCRFLTNYGFAWFPNDDNSTLFSFAVETNGAYWDNVKFTSCIFGGLVLPRAFVCNWDNCQFFVNPGRVVDSNYDYSQNVFITLGSACFTNCYFEDHSIAISAAPYTADITSLTVRDCHFSGVTNYVGKASKIKYAIQAGGGPFGDIGPIAIENCRVKSSGYTAKAFFAQGVTGHEINTHNIGAPGIAVTRDYSFSNMLVQERLLTGGAINTIPVGMSISTYKEDRALRYKATNSDLDAFYTPGGVLADSQVSTPFLKSTRYGTGTGNSESWGLSIENSTKSDTVILNWASTTYTTGGPIVWVPNDNPFMYIPSGKSFSIGFGASSQVPVQFAANGITSPGGYTASSTDYTAIGNVPQVLKFTVSRTLFSTAALSASATLFQLQPKQFIMSVMIKHTASFTGGAIASYTLQVGNGGTANKYASAFNVFQAPGNSVFGYSTSGGMEDFSTAQNVQITATSTGANLNAATAGSADIYVVIGKLP